MWQAATIIKKPLQSRMCLKKHRSAINSLRQIVFRSLVGVFHIIVEVIINHRHLITDPGRGSTLFRYVRFVLGYLPRSDCTKMQRGCPMKVDKSLIVVYYSVFNIYLVTASHIQARFLFNKQTKITQSTDRRVLFEFECWIPYKHTLNNKCAVIVYCNISVR